MTWLYILAGVVIALLILKKLGVFDSARPQQKETALPYRKKDYLLTKAERNFFVVLYPIAQQNNWHLFVKVRLEDLFWIPKGLEKHERWGWRGRIKSRHVDFVICDKENIRPLVAIELDDSTHNRADRVERDGFYARLFRTSGLSLLRFKISSFYNAQEMLTSILKSMQ